jgi:hypothetical protein
VRKIEERIRLMSPAAVRATIRAEMGRLAKRLASDFAGAGAGAIRCGACSTAVI